MPRRQPLPGPKPEYTTRYGHPTRYSPNAKYIYGRTVGEAAEIMEGKRAIWAMAYLEDAVQQRRALATEACEEILRFIPEVALQAVLNQTVTVDQVREKLGVVVKKGKGAEETTPPPSSATKTPRDKGKAPAQETKASAPKTTRGKGRAAGKENVGAKAAKSVEETLTRPPKKVTKRQPLKAKKNV